MTPARVERIAFPRSDAHSDLDADLDVDVAVDASLFAQCREIRRIVFIEEQSVPAELEWDGLDGRAEHFLALTGQAGGARALGTARMRIVGDAAKAERVAVLESARRLGVGRLLMEAIEALARERSLARIRLNAQVSAVPFYERLGYHGEGEVFLQAGIEHLAMSMHLD